jgi:hypothetical protein
MHTVPSELLFTEGWEVLVYRRLDRTALHTVKAVP